MDHLAAAARSSCALRTCFIIDASRSTSLLTKSMSSGQTMAGSTEDGTFHSVQGVVTLPLAFASSWTTLSIEVLDELQPAKSQLGTNYVGQIKPITPPQLVDNLQQALALGHAPSSSADV